MNEKDLPTSWYYNIVNFQIISKKKKRIDDSENYRMFVLIIFHPRKH